MADVTKVQASDGTIYTINDEDDYTKDEIDAMLADKADVGVSYTKAEEDILLADKPSNADLLAVADIKADKNDTYTKTEVDGLLDTKAGVGVSYTKAEDDALLDAKADKTDVDDALLLKANKADTYTKSEADVLLADKADVGDSYTKAEDDALLADKADSTAVYTKAEVDALIGGIKMFPDLDWANPLHTFVANDLTYNATEDCWLFGTLTGDGCKVTIDSTIVTNQVEKNTHNGLSSLIFPLTHIKAGSIVTLSGYEPQYSMMRVYKEV